MARILVVDDEVPFRTFVCMVVERMGHTPVEAGDGEEALEVFKSQDIDLCVVDVSMPKMKGTEFLHHAKEHDPQAVVIIMTGYPSAETIIETIGDEGYTYISKPFTVEKIMDLIKRGLDFRQTTHNKA